MFQGFFWKGKRVLVGRVVEREREGQRERERVNEQVAD